MNLRLLSRNPVDTSDTASGAAGANEVRVQVLDGYRPDTIRVTAGAPLRITFWREDMSPCSEQVVFPAFGKSATLPRRKEVEIDLLPEEPGEYEFTCGMSMLRGKLVVVAREVPR